MKMRTKFPIIGPRIGSIEIISKKGMDKVEAAKPSDVKTIVSFNLPFALHLLNDVYQMKVDGNVVEFKFKRVKTKSFQYYLGKEPMSFSGGGEILEDKYGRLANTFTEVRIPYRVLDDKVYSYQCPKCKVELLDEKTHCHVCGSTFSENLSRQVPRSAIKSEAVKLMNRLLEIYRFFSKEYYIEKVRDFDIIAFKYQYLLGDGTRIPPSPDGRILDTAQGVSVKAIPPIEQIDDFRRFLAKGIEIQLVDSLLIAARRHLTNEQWRLAILDSFTALETFLSFCVKTILMSSHFEELYKKMHEHVRVRKKDAKKVAKYLKELDKERYGRIKLLDSGIRNVNLSLEEEIPIEKKLEKYFDSNPEVMENFDVLRSVFKGDKSEENRFNNYQKRIQEIREQRNQLVHGKLKDPTLDAKWVVAFMETFVNDVRSLISHKGISTV